MLGVSAACLWIRLVSGSRAEAKPAKLEDAHLSHLAVGRCRRTRAGRRTLDLARPNARPALGARLGAQAAALSRALAQQVEASLLGRGDEGRLKLVEPATCREVSRRRGLGEPVSPFADPVSRNQRDRR